MWSQKDAIFECFRIEKLSSKQGASSMVVVRVWISRAMVQIRISFVLLQMETLQIGGAGVHSSLLLINQGTSFCIC